MSQDIARERALTADGRERCGALAPAEASLPRCALSLGHSGVHQSAETHDGDDWAEAPLPGTEAAFLGNVEILTQGAFERRVVPPVGAALDALHADLDSARDRFIRMEGRHEKLKRKCAKRRKALAKAVGESPKAPMDVLIIMAADQRAYLAELRAELQHADAERERLTIANAGLSEDIADLEHALAEAEDRIADLEDALKGSQEVAAWWLKVATNTAAKRMLRPASTEDGEGR